MTNQVPPQSPESYAGGSFYTGIYPSALPQMAGNTLTPGSAISAISFGTPGSFNSYGIVTPGSAISAISFGTPGSNISFMGVLETPPGFQNLNQMGTPQVGFDFANLIQEMYGNGDIQPMQPAAPLAPNRVTADPTYSNRKQIVVDGYARPRITTSDQRADRYEARTARINA